MYEAMESAEDAAREIADIYAKASRDLNYRLSMIYERYRDKYNLSDQDAMRLLNTIRDPGDLKELKSKLEGLKGPEAAEILKELESPAYRARIERFQNLQTEIDRMMADVYQQEKKISTNHYVNQYTESYYREIYDLKKRTGMDFSFSYVNDKELNRILRTNWSGANYSKRIWGNTRGLAKELKTQMTLAYLTGKNESEIAGELANKYATGAAYARRLVRTESAYVSGQAQAAADQEAGIESYKIIATLDLRTSNICREMDGKEFAYKDMEVGVNYPPFHPFCRTTVLSELDDQNLGELKRRSRDPETGKVKTFSGDITYQRWYKDEVANNPEALFAEQVAKHRGADLQQHERYVERLGKKKVGSIDDFRELKYKTPEEFEKLKELYKNPLSEVSADIERNMAIRNGNIYGIQTTGGKDIDKEILKDIDNAIHKLHKEHENIKVDKISFLPGDKLGSDIARAAIDKKTLKTTLKLNGDIFSDPEALKNILEHMPEGISEKDGLYGYLLHEYTHFMEYDYVIKKHTINGITDAAKVKEDLNHCISATELLKEALSSCGLDYNDGIIQTISEYATYNNAETIAEAYSYKGTDKPLCEAIKKLVNARWRK